MKDSHTSLDLQSTSQERRTPASSSATTTWEDGVERLTISKILKSKRRWFNVPADEHSFIAKHRIEYDLLKI
ncbi:hypothetical protein CYLTODRAFT_460039 [Cylindrobasidium torrendii FP15055 ss-10]|uniref:Uncharacterized protein n=1 Tax=Cylindrobasidium torrendii FP15055 ss-10 TaxID=1314674 RepID=A0A0D7ASQ0_9AGAR|nr:hypothetical protein CYLTODRAFT_460039 [Cylindrobasidium torrendii FP15055 ss-10]